MGKAIPYSIRLIIVSRLSSGESISDLSSELGYSLSGIRKIWLSYKKEGESALLHKYGNCGRKAIYDKDIYLKAKEIRDNMQGGCYVRSKLIQKYPELAVPHERTLQRNWLAEGSNRQKGRPSNKEKRGGVLRYMKFGKLMEKSKYN